MTKIANKKFSLPAKKQWAGFGIWDLDFGVYPSKSEGQVL